MDIKNYINKKTVIVLLIIAMVALGAAVYFYLQLSASKANPQKTAQDEAQNLVNKVGKLIMLPENEMPTIATVTDPEALKNQPFFTNAKSGDKVLIFTSSKKAILYNPDSNKIIEVAPINIGSAPTANP